MKRKLTIITLLLAVISVKAQSPQKLDEKNGFKSIRFGMNIDSLKKTIPMVLIESDPEMKTYYYSISSQEFKKIGSSVLNNVYVISFNGKVGEFMIDTKGLINSRAILETLQSAYGIGKQSNEYIKEYFWFGEKVIMTYKENSATNDADITIVSQVFLDGTRELKKTLSDKATGDL